MPANYQFGDWLVEPDLNRVRQAEDQRVLEPQAMNVLVYLLDHPDTTVSVDEILAEVWDGRIVESSAVARTINQIRRALDDSPQQAKYIQTVARRGYRTIAPVQPLQPGTRKSVPQNGGAEASAKKILTKRYWYPLAALMVVTAALIAGHQLNVRSDPGQSEVRQFTIELPGELRAQNYLFRPVAISRDGRMLVFNTTIEGREQLYARPLHSLDVEAIDGTEGAEASIALSPDGHWIAFVDRRTSMLMKVASTGGIPAPVGPVERPVPALTWTTRDEIIFEDGSYPGLMRVSAAGGQPSAQPRRP